MKSLLTTLLALSCVTHCWGASSIDPANKFAYGANFGWLNWRGDEPTADNGAVIGEFVCSGYVYAANTGWIHLGAGAPDNGIHYQNNSATDYGINVDPLGNLRGHAYGANIGWLNFEDLGAPKVDLFTGVLSGSIWGANVGWISLSNLFAHVQTQFILSGLDADQDGLPDAWELTFARSLETLDGDGDLDHDGSSNRSEYLAGTNPVDARSHLGITMIQASEAVAALSWPSQPGRLYRVESRTDLNSTTPWADVGLGWIVPDPGGVTTFRLETAPQRFFRIQVSQPLLR